MLQCAIAGGTEALDAGGQLNDAGLPIIMGAPAVSIGADGRGERDCNCNGSTCPGRNGEVVVRTCDPLGGDARPGRAFALLPEGNSSFLPDENTVRAVVCADTAVEASTEPIHRTGVEFGALVAKSGAVAGAEGLFACRTTASGLAAASASTSDPNLAPEPRPITT